MTDFQVRCFLALIEAKSFQNAAKALYVSQATVSRYVDSLEKELGVPLLLRQQGKRFVLSEAGKQVADDFSQIIRLTDQITSKCRAFNEKEKGRLSIGCLRNSHAIARLSKVLENFHNYYPDMTIKRIREEERILVTGLRIGTFDAILMAEHYYVKKPEDGTIHMGDLEAGVMIHRKSDLFYKENLGIGDIQNLEFIRYNPFAVPLKDDYLYNLCINNYNFEPNVVSEREDFEQFLFDLEMGFGAAIILEEQILENNELLRFVPLKEKMKVPIYLKFSDEDRNACEKKLFQFVKNAILNGTI